MMIPDQIESTITAIATPPGQGGVGIVRLSGRDSLSILKKLFKSHRPLDSLASHRMYYGWIIHPVSGEPLDEVLAVYMRAPCSYTREDVVEVHCHGGPLVLQAILEQILAAGAMAAAPGEFTKRAFLNGRIDLTRAEAVLEMLSAKTSEGLKLAAAQLTGRLENEVERLRQVLLDFRAILEVAIDFPEDEGDILADHDFRGRLTNEVVGPLRQLIDSADQGKIFREGVSVVILGRPNVGKSSLLNALLKEERAIVSPVPGTTRDTIEEYIDILGIPVRIVDTAGIRETREAVEEIGIQRARRKTREADLVLLLLDATEAISREDLDLYDSINKPVILVVNKVDLLAETAVAIDRFAEAFQGETVVSLSAKTTQGLDALEGAIRGKVVASSRPEAEHRTAPNVRHKASLVKALAVIERVVQGVSNVLAPDLLAIELQEALDCFGEIVGETTTEEVLDRIFSQFCIGK